MVGVTSFSSAFSDHILTLGDVVGQLNRRRPWPSVVGLHGSVPSSRLAEHRVGLEKVLPSKDVVPVIRAVDVTKKVFCCGPGQDGLAIFVSS